MTGRGGGIRIHTDFSTVFETVASCQLGYTPVAPSAELESATYGLEVRCSIQLSYEGIKIVAISNVLGTGLEPVTKGL